VDACARAYVPSVVPRPWIGGSQLALRREDGRFRSVRSTLPTLSRSLNSKRHLPRACLGDGTPARLGWSLMGRGVARHCWNTRASDACVVSVDCLSADEDRREQIRRTGELRAASGTAAMVPSQLQPSIRRHSPSAE
jgi:hypothetical protein